jgi:hypothetical protein
MREASVLGLPGEKGFTEQKSGTEKGAWESRVA